MNIKDNIFKLRPKFVKTITFGFAAAITLWPFGIYFRSQKYLDKEHIRNHESIHWKQSKELLGLFFYILYVVEWIYKMGIYGKYAYYNISFEREANAHENDKDYLKHRKPYAWIKYLKYQ